LSPVIDRLALGPARVPKARPQIIELGLRDVEPELRHVVGRGDVLSLPLRAANLGLTRSVESIYPVPEHSKEGRRVDGTAPVEQARMAVATGAWPDAYAAFRIVDPSELTARDLDAMADAAWWVSQLAESVELRHKAYSAHVTAGDERGAAAAAARVAVEHFVRGESSVGAGFLMRARRHADALSEGPEHGFVDMLEGVVAFYSGDHDRALELSDRAIDFGRRFGVIDLTAMAIHVKGLALVSAGRVIEGVALLDEAMAAVLSGDVTPYFMGIIYCSVIGSCLELGDIGRAGEWSDALAFGAKPCHRGRRCPGCAASTRRRSRGFVVRGPTRKPRPVGRPMS
jgi:hypothetical protein